MSKSSSASASASAVPPVATTNGKNVGGHTIAASWPKSQEYFVKKWIKKSKRDSRVAENLYESLVLSTFAPNLVSKLQVLEIGLCENTMTVPGLQRHAELICMTSKRPFNYFAIGTGTDPTTSQTTSLTAEIARVNMDGEDGFRVPAGNNILECGYFEETYPTFTATEAGCFDGDGTNATDEVLEWRTVYPLSQQVTHTQNVNFMTYIHTIFQTAV